MGSETVGTVEAAGANVRDFRVGDRVAAALFGATSGTGGYAEYVTVRAPLIVAIPDAVSDDDAVAVMLQGLVARMLLRETPVAARSVAITAAAGGVGSMLIQLARLDGAMTIVGLAGSTEKLSTVRALGADQAVSYRDDAWVDRLAAATGGTFPTSCSIRSVAPWPARWRPALRRTVVSSPMARQAASCSRSMTA